MSEEVAQNTDTCYQFLNIFLRENHTILQFSFILCLLVDLGRTHPMASILMHISNQFHGTTFLIQYLLLSGYYIHIDALLYMKRLQQFKQQKGYDEC